MFDQSDKKIFCPNCGYSMIKPFPKICPKCKWVLAAIISDYDQMEKEKQRGQFKEMEESAQKVALKKSAALAPQEFKKSTESAARKIKGVKVKKKESQIVNFDDPMIEIVPGQEYIKLLGVVQEDRIPLFCSNPKYEYFLELSCNLAVIATSILSGELDRMVLYSEELGRDEKCLFLQNDHVIYIIYGVFPDRKGLWVLNRMHNEMVPILKSAGKKMPDLSKLELHTIKTKFLNFALGIMNEYVELTEVFSDKPIPSIDQTVRVDYFGLSFQSIGVLSKIIGEELDVQGATADDPAMKKELQESLITAKLEAIAANTFANTRAIPKWIGVKLSFEAFRFIIFEALPNGYFYQILAEGNLQAGINLREQLSQILAGYTKEPFRGDLSKFQPVSQELDDFFTQRVFEAPREEE
jgi:hypothetical protein